MGVAVAALPGWQDFAGLCVSQLPVFCRGAVAQLVERPSKGPGSMVRLDHLG